MTTQASLLLVHVFVSRCCLSDSSTVFRRSVGCGTRTFLSEGVLSLLPELHPLLPLNPSSSDVMSLPLSQYIQDTSVATLAHIGWRPVGEGAIYIDIPQTRTIDEVTQGAQHGCDLVTHFQVLQRSCHALALVKARANAGHSLLLITLTVSLVNAVPKK